MATNFGNAYITPLSQHEMLKRRVATLEDEVERLQRWPSVYESMLTRVVKVEQRLSRLFTGVGFVFGAGAGFGIYQLVVR